MKKKSAKPIIRKVIEELNAQTAVLTVTCEVGYRLTRPKNHPGAYTPWNSDRGFIWNRGKDVEVKATSLDAMVLGIRTTAEGLADEYVGDDLEAVKLDGSCEVEGVRVTFSVLVEKE